MENIETKPDLEGKRSHIIIEQHDNVEGGTKYLLTWRGLNVKADTLDEALEKLSTDIKELG